MKLERMAFAAIVALSLGIPAAGWAGGSMDEDEANTDEGPSYFGFVRDARGLGVGDAKVTAELKGRGSLITRTNVLGSYKIPGFGKDVNPEDVTITCSKEGYQQTGVMRRTMPGADSKAAIETECTLKHL